MTKEDKQIIDRAVKGNWRIGDRTRLKHLLEKNLKLYRENAELEKENRLLGERCNQLLKDKGELTDKIADIKANCDYFLEGKDLEIKQLKMTAEYIIKTLESKVEKLQEDLRRKRISIKNKKAEIKELELELTVEKDQHQEEINLHLHAEDYIKSLEKENKTLEGCLLTEQEHTQMLEQQIEKMKCCANCKSFKGYGETCEGWGEPVLNLNCDCTEWELKEKEK